MAFVDKIVKSINDTIKVVLSGYKSNIGCVVDFTDDGNERLFLKDQAGNSYAVPDDRYELTIFHVAENTNYSQNEQQFGEEDSMYEAVTNVRLIAFATANTNLSNRSLVDLLLSCLPSTITLHDQTDKGLYQTIVEVKESSYNSLDVFSSLYNGIDYAISPNECLVSVTYSLTSMIERTCLPTCIDC